MARKAEPTVDSGQTATTACRALWYTERTEGRENTTTPNEGAVQARLAKKEAKPITGEGARDSRNK